MKVVAPLRGALKKRPHRSRSNASASGASSAFWTSVTIDRSSGEPLQRQLYDQLREAILVGALRSGTRLASSRALASEVGCSRNTVLAVVAQLTAEGYLASERGSGVFVADDFPDELLSVPAPPSDWPLVERCRHPPELSRRGKTLAATLVEHPAPWHAPFATLTPDVSLFPLTTWNQLANREWRDHGSFFLKQADARGFEPLRIAIADYLRATRNVVCGAYQVIITAGSQHGTDLLARLLLDHDDCVWVEDPGYLAIRALFRAAGARVVSIAVDEGGMVLPQPGSRIAPPRLIYVSPSHHYPTGVTMTLRRRLEFLNYAEHVGAWILEDDYDSEFRYEGRRLAALQSLNSAASARVIYMGTFTKALFPAIRLGYLVVPSDLAHTFARGRSVIDIPPSIVAQPALARFIAEGHLAAHIRRMRRIYRGRHEALVAALARHATALLHIEPDQAGMHLLARFTPELAARYDDVTAAQRLCERGLNAQPLSMFYAKPSRDNGFLLGYACADEAALERAVVTMVSVLCE